MTTKQTENQAASTGNIYARIPAIMRELPAVPKDRKNEGQGYKFRGIDEVYNLVHPIMAAHGVFMSATILTETTTERPSKNGGVLITRSMHVRYRFTADDGSYIETDVIGEGMDSGDKAANKAMSVGQKYAILQTFLVPTDDPKDPECDDPAPAPRHKTAPAAADGPDDFFDEPPAQSPFDQLPDFSKAKKALGDDVYYRTLKVFGYAHANESPVEKRSEILKALRLQFKAVKTGTK